MILCWELPAFDVTPHILDVVDSAARLQRDSPLAATLRLAREGECSTGSNMESALMQTDEARDAQEGIRHQRLSCDAVPIQRFESGAARDVLTKF
jgi:hypothetical protein